MSRLRYDNLPGAFSGKKSRRSVMAVWDDMARKLYSPRVLAGLPPFAEKLAKTFWLAGSDAAIEALRRGDPAWFIAFLIRLDQIHVAMLAAGRSEAERQIVFRSRYIVDGLREAATERLIADGGVWPLTGAPTEEPAEEPSEP